MMLREILSDNRSGRGSSKRAVALIATVAMSITLIILAVAAYMGRAVDVAIGSVSMALAGLGSANYVGGKWAENKPGNINQPKDQAP